MDGKLASEQELRAACLWTGQASPNEAAEVLSLLLPLLPLEARARAACVCRAWRTAAAHPEVWEELSFKRCTARVNDATLASLCERAGVALRTLYLDEDACTRISGDGVLAALRGGGCIGLRRLDTEQVKPRYQVQRILVLNAELTPELVAACPMLQHTACTVVCSLNDAPAVMTALPGPLTIVRTHDSDTDTSSLAHCMRLNTSLTTLDLHDLRIGDPGVMRLAEIKIIACQRWAHKPELARKRYRCRRRDAASGVSARQYHAHEPGLELAPWPIW